MNIDMSYIKSNIIDIALIIIAGYILLIIFMHILNFLIHIFKFIFD